MARGIVYSAKPLSQGDIYAIEDAFFSKLGQPVTLDMVVDETLIAGVNVVVEGVSYDGSVKGQLLSISSLLRGDDDAGGGP